MEEGAKSRVHPQDCRGQTAETSRAGSCERASDGEVRKPLLPLGRRVRRRRRISHKVRSLSRLGSSHCRSFQVKNPTGNVEGQSHCFHLMPQTWRAGDNQTVIRRGEEGPKTQGNGCENLQYWGTEVPYRSASRQFRVGGEGIELRC